MTAYEIASLAESIVSNFLSTFTIFVSLVTTYVVAAFVAGDRLSKLQVTVVNLCFLMSTSIVGFLSIQMFQRATEMAQRSITQFQTVISPYDISWVVVALYVGLLVGALTFMASVRRHKGDAEA
jgi:hypothetical protein